MQLSELRARDRGINLPAAMAQLARERPELHAEFLAASARLREVEADLQQQQRMAEGLARISEAGRDRIRRFAAENATRKAEYERHRDLAAAVNERRAARAARR